MIHNEEEEDLNQTLGVHDHGLVVDDDVDVDVFLFLGRQDPWAENGSGRPRNIPVRYSFYTVSQTRSRPEVLETHSPSRMWEKSFFEKQRVF